MAKKPVDAPLPRVDFDALRLPWHEAAWRRLSAQLDAGRMPHAVLVTGIAGLGKDLFAQRLTLRLLCESPHEGDACGGCRGCTQFLAGTHPDYHLLTMREDKSQIVIDQVRDELVGEMQLSSQYGAYKVALITPADRMNRNAFNALLKTLEEPSGHSVLVLVTARPARLSATIRSRCQQVAIAPPAAEDGVAWLRARKVRDPELLLALAGGAPLAAAALADSALLDARGPLLRTLLDLAAGQTDAPAAAQAWVALPFADALDWLQTVVHDMIRLRQLGADAALVNEDLRRDLQSGAHRLDWLAMHRHLDELVRLRALTETPVVAQLQWESVMTAWSSRLDTALLA